MGTFPVLIVLSFIAANSINKVTADCIDEEEHIYECRAPDEEAEDLTCSGCFPDGEDGHYNCSCWIKPTEQNEKKSVYLTCQDAYMHGETKTGVYRLKPDHLPPFKAYCDMETDGGGWTVFQRRMDGSVDFHLGWDDYVHGFGKVRREYWLGLSKLHRLANSTMPSRLRVDLGSFSNGSRYAEYSIFYIGSSSSDYQLHISGYRGNAGDGMASNNGRKFSTKDNDNDSWSSNSCAVARHGAWWYGGCSWSNLNGRYYTSGVSSSEAIYWHYWLVNESLKSTVMMIRQYKD